jgi:hypothetical protein
MKGLWCLVAVLVLPSPGLLAAQVSLAGVVRHGGTRAPMAGVEVLVEGTDRRVLTGRDGRYLMDRLPAGRRTVVIRLIGYLPVHAEVFLSAGDTTRLDVAMVPSAVVLRDIDVTGRSMRGVGMGREAFEERRNRGFGIFIDSTVLRRYEHRDLGDIVRGNPGISISSRQRGGGYIILAGRGALRCPVQMYLDGVALPRGESTRIVPVSNLEAVEVYRSSLEAPMEYGGPRANCGVILLWTRRGG